MLFFLIGATSTLELIDEDSMTTDSETRPPSQQSVKAYVDANVAGLSEDSVQASNVNWTDMTDLDEDGAVTWGNLGEGELPDNSVTGADLKDDLAFGTFPTTPESAPDADYEVANKKYVDDNGGGSGAFTLCKYIEYPTADDDLKSIFANKTAGNWTLTEMWGESDQDINWDFQVDDGTPADVNGTDLACSAGECEDTSLSGDTTLAAGEELDLAITAVANEPTWSVHCITGTR